MANFTYWNLAFGFTLTKWPHSQIVTLHFGPLLQYDHFHLLQTCIKDHFHNVTNFTHWNIAFRIISTIHQPLLYPLNHSILYYLYNMTTFIYSNLTSGTTFTVWIHSPIDSLRLWPLLDHLYRLKRSILYHFYNLTTFIYQTPYIWDHFYDMTIFKM